MSSKRKLSGKPPSKRRGESSESRIFWRLMSQPTHRDGTLSVTTDETGRVHLHCSHGCSEATICKALGLSLSDLYPPDHPDRPKERL